MSPGQEKRERKPFFSSCCPHLCRRLRSRKEGRKEEEAIKSKKEGFSPQRSKEEEEEVEEDEEEKEEEEEEEEKMTGRKWTHRFPFLSLLLRLSRIIRPG